jgi:DNA-binding transcriptional LysR family regulator
MPALQCDDLQTLRLVALSTDTVLIATRDTLRNDLQSGNMVELDLSDWPAMSTGFSIVTLRNRTPSPMARTAMDCIEHIAVRLSAM